MQLLHKVARQCEIAEALPLAELLQPLTTAHCVVRRLAFVRMITVEQAAQLRLSEAAAATQAAATVADLLIAIAVAAVLHAAARVAVRAATAALAALAVVVEAIVEEASAEVDLVAVEVPAEVEALQAEVAAVAVVKNGDHRLERWLSFRTNLSNLI